MLNSLWEMPSIVERALMEMFHHYSEYSIDVVRMRQTVLRWV